MENSVKWLKEHDAEVFAVILYLSLKVASLFVTAEDEFLYATLHGHSDDVLGALLMIWFVKRFHEKVTKED